MTGAAELLLLLLWIVVVYGQLTSIAADLYKSLSVGLSVGLSV